MFLIFLLIFSLFFTRPILASDNIFGLHLTQTEDIYQAKDIINSNNGDWGWSTIVLNSQKLDKTEWQNFFDNCRKFHIIPIIRIATSADGDNWKRPEFSEIDNLANFLNSLNWPTKNQYIILFNEVNHAQEWGGEVSVKDFADKAIYTIDKFKKTNPNFYILSSGLDLAAPDNLPNFQSAESFYQELYNYKPEYFDKIDGLSSHSYPNHGYIGTPKDTGEHSIVGYKWELEYLQKLGVTKNLPVFITETGWPHREGVKKNNDYFTTETSSNFLIDALNLWSQDKNVQAVTPFIFNYTQEPFDHFSWLDKDEKLYPSYQKLINLPKNKNRPEQITSYKMEKISLPFLIFDNTEYTGEIILKNNGQSVWGENNFCLTSTSSSNIEVESLCTGSEFIYPNQYKIFKFKFKITKNQTEKSFISWQGLDNFEIKPFNKNASIYHSDINIFQKVINSFKSFFYQTLVNKKSISA